MYPYKCCKTKENYTKHTIILVVLLRARGADFNRKSAREFGGKTRSPKNSRALCTLCFVLCPPFALLCIEIVYKQITMILLRRAAAGDSIMLYMLR